VKLEENKKAVSVPLIEKEWREKHTSLEITSDNGS
jgi:hypothetical protein